MTLKRCAAVILCLACTTCARVTEGCGSPPAFEISPPGDGGYAWRWTRDLECTCTCLNDADGGPCALMLPGRDIPRAERARE